jgi:hypothetical protein
MSAEPWVYQYMARYIGRLIMTNYHTKIIQLYYLAQLLLAILLQVIIVIVVCIYFGNSEV